MRLPGSTRSMPGAKPRWVQLAWSQYVAQRAELKAALDGAIAARPPVR